MAFNSKDHLQVLERCQKTIAPSLIRGIFDVELTYVFLILSSYCQYFLFFAIKLSRPVTNHAGNALDFQKFPTCRYEKLQQQGSFTQIFNGQLKSDS